MKKHIPLIIGMVLPLIAAACGVDNDEGVTNVTFQLVQQEIRAGSDFDLAAIPDDVHYLQFQVWEYIPNPQGEGTYNYFIGDEGHHDHRVDITDKMREEGYILVGFLIPNGPERGVSVYAYRIDPDPDHEDMVVYSGSASGIDLTGEPITVTIHMLGS